MLADIDTPEIDQQLEQARADLATAEANTRLAQPTAERYRDLIKTDSVSKQDLDNANGSLEAKATAVTSAKANVRRLEQLKAFGKITAPFDGVVTARNTDVGALIDSGSNAKELFHVAAVHRLRVFVNVPEIYSRAARPGMKADLTLTEFPGRAFTGTLARTAQSIDVASRTLLTEIDVENPKGELLPGSYAEVHLKLPSDAVDLQAAGQRGHLPHRRRARRRRRRGRQGRAAAGHARTRLRQQPRGRRRAHRRRADHRQRARLDRGRPGGPRRRGEEPVKSEQA